MIYNANVQTPDLVKIIKKLDHTILANTGIDSLDEILKLLLVKLYDEKHKNELNLQEEDAEVVYKKTSKLLKKAQNKWIEAHKEEILLTPQVLKVCMKELSSVEIFKTDMEIFDAAIEHLLPHTFRGNRGQFFTPRHVIKEIISMLAPRADESILDPACGSGGFLEYAILHQGKKEDYAKKKVHGADYDTRLAKVARLTTLVASNTQVNIRCLNTISDQSLMGEFDIVICNPPYAGKITDQKVLEKFELAKNGKGKIAVTPRHILFLEKIIKATTPGGRIAVIMPQGVLNNTGMEKVHQFIFQNTRICAVVSLPQNTFMPHTNTKTSILILQKWKTKKLSDYPIFMAVSKKIGKDRKGKVVKKNGKIDHDLMRITQCFQKFKKNKLNF